MNSLQRYVNYYMSKRDCKAQSIKKVIIRVLSNKSVERERYSPKKSIFSTQVVDTVEFRIDIDVLCGNQRTRVCVSYWRETVDH